VAATRTGAGLSTHTHGSPASARERKAPGRVLQLAGPTAATAVAVLLVCLGGVAAAATGGAPTPGGGPPPPPSSSGEPDPAPTSGALRLISARTSPRKSFYYGIRSPRLRYVIGSNRPDNDLRIDVVDSTGLTVKTFYRNDIAPGVPDSVRWDGAVAGGRPARNGRYIFRILPQGGEPAVRRALRQSIRRARRRASSSSRSLSLSFNLYAFAFPILGAHRFGGTGGRFGAGRSGHSHQGQDVMTKCGVPLIAARGGRVQYSGFQRAAGNYLVIDGKGTGFDMAYMHLLRPSPLRRGAVVRTGQPIGLVGRTGDASACHLHFEIWALPGWYEGGNPIDPLPFLKRWDRYS
jgi:murein DD-endopeptidase MepM/ murein hydrolase activator NlpD